MGLSRNLKHTLHVYAFPTTITIGPFHTNRGWQRKPLCRGCMKPRLYMGNGAYRNWDFGLHWAGMLLAWAVSDAKMFPCPFSPLSACSPLASFVSSYVMSSRIFGCNDFLGVFGRLHSLAQLHHKGTRSLDDLGGYSLCAVKTRMYLGVLKVSCTTVSL
jgi:hypothetical protein